MALTDRGRTTADMENGMDGRTDRQRTDDDDEMDDGIDGRREDDDVDDDEGNDGTDGEIATATTTDTRGRTERRRNM